MEAKGVVVLEIDLNPKDAIALLEKALAKNGVTIYATIDQQEEMKKIGIATTPLVCLIFGNPSKGIAVMQENIVASLDLPLKIIAWQDEENRRYVAYNEISYLVNRYLLSKETAALIDVAPMVSKIFNGHLVHPGNN